MYVEPSAIPLNEAHEEICELCIRTSGKLFLDTITKWPDPLRQMIFEKFALGVLGNLYVCITTMFQDMGFFKRKVTHELKLDRDVVDAFVSRIFQFYAKCPVKTDDICELL